MGLSDSMIEEQRAESSVGRGRASTLSSAEALHPALPAEGATQAPANESGSQEESLDSKSSKQRADASVEGEAPSGYAGGGGDASPFK
ncbi:MAG: hypothetical protein HZA13_08555 [Nitrospirae bacterium]|nr:hypothetical protein [Nitrospirota bacterium]